MRDWLPRAMAPRNPTHGRRTPTRGRRTPSHGELARSFDAAAQVYARARPGYPEQALDWLLPAHARDVLDLGAGTGKLTAQLAARGLNVTAVEPSDRMRAELEAVLRERVTALSGRAERIPLPDGSVDVVLVAQAWHWVDPARAVPEVARVLRSGGRLGLVWNCRDERVPWVAELGAMLARPGEPTDTAGAAARHTDLGPPFGPLERFETEPWTQTLTPAGLVELAASRSYVITLEAAPRAELLDRVRGLLDRPELSGRTEIELPYVTECVRAELPR
jgi:SAM-dependent methyltransferase